MGEIILRDAYRTSAGVLKGAVKVESDQVVNIHCINGGLSVHLRDGSTFGSTRDRLKQILDQIAQHEGPDRLEEIPLQFEDRTNVGYEVLKQRYAIPASTF